VASGLVLVIEDDEWVSRLLTNAIRDAGYDVVTCATAKEGFEMACSEEPSCIICDVELPDGDGFWVARSIRAEPTRVSATPFIFLTGLDDPQSRMEGYQVGADIYITKPFRIQEVVAQIDALVQMAERMRRAHDSQRRTPTPASGGPGDETSEITGELNDLIETPVPSEAMGAREQKPKSEPVTAIEGDLSQMSIATVLTVLEMERRTGIFEVVSKKRRAQLEIASGAVVQGQVGGTRVSALTTLRTMLGWTVGRFSFAPLPTRDPPTTRKSISAFLLEATRLEDEAMRDELELPPSRRVPGQRLSAPALGGTPSADDLGPMSSRGSMSLPVPSSTQPAQPAHKSQPEAAHASPSGAGPGRASQPQIARPVPPPPAAHAGASSPSTRRSSDVPPRPPSQSGHGPQAPMLELDEIEPISAAPTGGTPLFPGLSNITGTHRNMKLNTSHTPPKPPPPPPMGMPKPAGGGHTPVTGPPPLPKRDSVTPPKPPMPPPGMTPRRAAEGTPGASGPPPLPKTAARPGPPPPPTAKPPGPPPPKPEPQKKR
jgi:two-component system, OmpR family, response regulator